MGTFPSFPRVAVLLIATRVAGATMGLPNPTFDAHGSETRLVDIKVITSLEPDSIGVAGESDNGRM